MVSLLTGMRSSLSLTVGEILVEGLCFTTPALAR